jgi:Putative beta barrel porin-7 (BBP7)
MKLLYISLLLMAIPCAGSARAQTADTWVAQTEDDGDLIDEAVRQGASFNEWSASAELLMWWSKATPCPVPLATTAPASALTNPADTYPPGNLANSDTTVVLGGQSVGIPMQMGGRFSLGHGLDEAEQFGVDATFLFFANRSTAATVTSNNLQSQFLTNPYTALDNVVFPAPGTPYANFLSSPASFSGPLATYGTATQTAMIQMYGAELNGLWNMWEGGGQSWHLIGGYRFLNVDEQMNLNTLQVDNNNFAGQFIATTDQFKTRNYFNGGQVGVRYDWRQGNWYFGTTAKIAAGSTYEVVAVNGSTFTNTGAGYTHIPLTTVPYGTYAQPSNIGHANSSQFAWLPEVSFKLGMQLSPSVRYYLGYNFLYLSNLVRPGNQIDGTINPLQTVGFNGGLPTSSNGGGHPAPKMVSSDFWAQGVMIGAEFGW